MKKKYIILYHNDSEKSNLRGAGDFSDGVAFERMDKSSKSPFSVEIDELNETKANQLTNNKNVFSVTPSIPLKLIRPLQSLQTHEVKAPSDDMPWNISAVGADVSEYDGKGIKIAILDTGIDKDHEAFRGINITEKDFTNVGNGDNDGHGTLCAGVAFGRDVAGQRIGIARGVKDVLIGKVVDNAVGETAMLIEAIEWAVKQGANVISMSLGIDFPGLAHYLEEKQGIPRAAAISMALYQYRQSILILEHITTRVQLNSEQKTTQPVILIGAAGNESERPNFRIFTNPPAVCGGMISVGALGKRDSGLYVADFSNTGVTLAAPGVDIISAEAYGGLKSDSSTSIATPHVAGIAALWGERALRSGRLTHASLSSHLISSCNSFHLRTENPQDYGEGLVMSP